MRPRRVCICRHVTEEQIRRAVLEGGAESFQEVQLQTGCSTGCGTCEPRIRTLLAGLLRFK